MVALRLTCALLVGWFATSALAGGRGASFSVTVRVVASLRTRTVVPTSFVAAGRAVALPCGAPSSPACSAAVDAARVTGSAVLVTVLTDGAPTSIVER